MQELIKVRGEIGRSLGSGTAPNCAMLVNEQRVRLFLAEKGYAHTSHHTVNLQAVNFGTQNELKVIA